MPFLDAKIHRSRAARRRGSWPCPSPSRARTPLPTWRWFGAPGRPTAPPGPTLGTCL